MSNGRAGTDLVWRAIRNSQTAEVIMKLIRTACVAVAAALAASPMVARGNDGTQDSKVTLTGCAVKGTGDSDGFLLANSVERTTRTTITPDAAGATVDSTTWKELGPARVLYWLDDDDDVVENMMGQLVEITGEVEGDVERGEIDIEREDGMIELEINADGRKANIKLEDVPSAIGRPRSVGDREEELPYVVRKLDVKSARSIAPTCR
jgi:hypothetical protein